jgi:hypothetical protein
MRKQQAIDTLKANLAKEQETHRRLLESKSAEDEIKPMIKKQGDVFKTTNPLLVLFQQHIRRLKDQIRQRKALTNLQNVKSMRVKPEDVALLQPDQILVENFKPVDKKQLLEAFFGDERVQIYVSQMLAAQASQLHNSALINADMQQQMAGSTSFATSNY